jgi:hypothetical protein
MKEKTKTKPLDISDLLIEMRLCGQFNLERATRVRQVLL